MTVHVCDGVKWEDTRQGTYFVGEHLDDRGRHVGGPHGDHPLSMAHAADSIVGVLPQHITWAHLGPVLRYGLACAGVLHISAQTAGSTHTAAQEGQAHGEGGGGVGVTVRVRGKEHPVPLQPDN